VTLLTLPCADCHSALGAGTVDHQLRAKARSATGRANPVSFGSSALLVAGGGSAPTYSDTSAQCANLYCHGAKMPGGDATGSSRTPTWGTSLLPATLSAAACGSCHGFPPSPTSGHPGGITIPAGFPASAALGATCSCHPNLNPAGNSYANIFVNRTLHLNGTLETPVGGHTPLVPNYQHQAAGTGAGCTGCHAIGTAASLYPAASLGSPPDCRGCHTKAAPGTGCGSCHGAADGRPTGTVFPDIAKNHTRSDHRVACTVCHGTAGSPQTTHGPGNRAAHGDANVVITMSGDGAGITFTRTGGGSGRCAGTCHGENHGSAPGRQW
jgi:predicted CxxxxCH...CXXCH cytochrome family protein